MIKGGGTEAQGADQIFTTNATIRQEAFAINPGTAGAWAEADLATLEIGVKVRS
jgi:hypothetical protein